MCSVKLLINKDWNHSQFVMLWNAYILLYVLYYFGQTLSCIHKRGWFLMESTNICLGNVSVLRGNYCEITWYSCKVTQSQRYHCICVIGRNSFRLGLCSKLIIGLEYVFKRQVGRHGGSARNCVQLHLCCYRITIFAQAKVVAKVARMVKESTKERSGC